MLDPVVERLMGQMLNDEITAEDALRLSGLPVKEFQEKATACLHAQRDELEDKRDQLVTKLKKTTERIGG